MTIQLNYDQPIEGQEQLFGSYTLGDGVLCTFRTPIVYTDGVIDIAATESNLLEVINQDLEVRAILGA